MDCIHTVALSLKGRDKGRLFLIIGYQDEAYALIADGKLRKLEKPKKKKLMHLKAIGTMNLKDPTAATNRMLRRLLKNYQTESNPVSEGGF